MPFFTPPTVQEGPAGGGPLFYRYKIPRGVTVLKNAGVYTEHRYPTDVQIDAADAAYIGGHIYQVSDAEAADLQAAGYTTTQEAPA
jgi:hypothetical protein